MRFTMKKYSRTQSSIFLLELILNLLLFTVLVIVGLNFFVKAHLLTIKTSDLHRAVTQCNNVAALYESGDGSLDLISKQYPYSVITENQAIVYFDDNLKECTFENSKYTLSIYISDSSKINEGTIIFSKDGISIYELTVCNYKQLTPSSKEV